MKTLLTIVGALLALAGAVWFLQGINILPGSFMTGQNKWAVIGSVTFFVGVALLIISRRMVRKDKSGQ